MKILKTNYLRQFIQAKKGRINDILFSPLVIKKMIVPHRILIRLQDVLCPAGSVRQLVSESTSGYPPLRARSETEACLVIVGESWCGVVLL
jgi:hypothetical protein